MNAHCTAQKKWEEMVKKFWQEASSQGRRIFSHGKVNVIPASWQQCSRLQQSHWICYWLFLLHTMEQWHCFSIGWTTFNNCPFPLVIWIQIYCMVAWAHLSLPSNWQLDRFSHFHGSWTWSNRLHLAIAVIWPKNQASSPLSAQS